MANSSFKNVINPSNAVASNITNSIISPRGDFFAALSQWETTVEMPFLFCVRYEMPSLLVDQQMQYWSENLINNSSWGVDQAISKLVTPFDSKITGCFFVQSISLPQEESNFGYAGIGNRGFKYSPYIKQRVQPSPFMIEFLETNTSYVDSIVRPHVILASHLGLVTRPEGTIKTDLTIYELAKSGNPQDSLVIRKTWLFKDCVPVKVYEHTKDYSTNEKTITRKTQWIYSAYQLIAGG